MNRYHEFIRDVVKRMQDEGYGQPENVHAYLATDIYREIRDDPSYRSLRAEAERQIQTQPRSVAISGTDKEEKRKHTFETYEVINVDGMMWFHEPRLPDGDVTVIDVGGLGPDPKSTTLVKHPVCIQRLRTIPRPDDDADARTCAECGSVFEVGVEGDKGETYCSIKCLNEVYV